MAETTEMEHQGEFFEVPREVVTDVEARADAEPVPALPGTITRRGMRDLTIPRLYYSISEVSRLTGLEQYVLRYWETEFEELAPQKNRAGNRIYSSKDITFILRIKDLLREKRYTIEGAKQILRDEPLADKKEMAPVPKADSNLPSNAIMVEAEELAEIKNGILALKALLSRKRLTS